MVTIEVGPIKDRTKTLVEFLKPRIGEVEVKEDKIEVADKPTSLVKTYLKRFLHKEGLKADHRVRVSKGVVRIIKVQVEEEESAE